MIDPADRAAAPDPALQPEWDYGYVSAPSLAVLVERMRDFPAGWKVLQVFQPQPGHWGPEADQSQWQAVMERMNSVDCDRCEYGWRTGSGAVCLECGTSTALGHDFGCKSAGHTADG